MRHSTDIGAALAFAIVLLLSATRVDAACLPGVPHYRYVGLAGDSHCTDTTIQAAIDNTTCPDTIIYVTAEQGTAYLQQHLNIIDKSLALVGTTAACGVSACGGDDCGTTPTVPIITLYGTTTVANSVIDITGNSHVTLKYLELRNASTNGYGGGIDFDGDGSLTLDTTYVDHNNAGSGGGGIRINGTNAATLNLLAHAHVTDNTAFDGGGILVTGNARLSALADDVFIFHNVAGNGGGIAVVGPATADIASPGPGGNLGAIYDNKATQYGGGIHIAGGTGGGSAQGQVRLFSVDARHPVHVQGNSASVGGGAISLKAGASSQSPAVLCARDFRIDDSLAPEGSAIYSDGANAIQTNFCNYGSFPDTAVACTPGVACNEISGNWAMDDAGNHTDGAAIYLAPQSVMSAYRVSLRHNQGGHVVRAAGQGLVQLVDSLIADNATTREPLWSAAGLVLSDSTLAGNAIQAGSVMHLENGNPFHVWYDIVWQPGKQVLDYSGDPSLAGIDYVLASETGSLVGGTHLYGGDPMFADAANGNYRLGAGSPALDVAMVESGIDLDGLPRSIDLPDADIDGPRDLGAYERQLNYSACAVVADTVYCNGFDAPLAR